MSAIGEQSQATHNPSPIDVRVAVDTIKIPTSYIDGYTQLVLTIIAVFLALLALTESTRLATGGIRSVQDILLVGPNGPAFQSAPLSVAIRDELRKQIIPWRILPVGNVILATSMESMPTGKHDVVWQQSRVERWRSAGFVTMNHERLSNRSSGNVAKLTPTEKGTRVACSPERRNTFGWQCLEAPLGEIEKLETKRSEWGKRGLYHYRLVLGTLAINPSPELRELYPDHNFWHFEWATVLQHDPFRDTWRVIVFTSGPMDDTGLDLAEIERYWATMEQAGGKH